jgi:hypothetical protein
MLDLTALRPGARDRLPASERRQHVVGATYCRENGGERALDARGNPAASAGSPPDDAWARGERRRALPLARSTITL